MSAALLEVARPEGVRPRPESMKGAAARRLKSRPSDWGTVAVLKVMRAAIRLIMGVGVVA